MRPIRWSRFAFPAVVGMVCAPVVAQGAPDGFRALLPAEHSCHVAWLKDPLELLEGLLRDPAVVQECRAGAIGDLLKVVAGIGDPDPRRVAAGIGLVRDEIPVAGALAWAPATGGAVGGALRAIVSLQVAGGALALEDEPERRAALTTLQQEALQSLAQLADLRASVWLRCRTARGAASWYERVTELLTGAAAELAFVQVRELPDRLQVTVRGRSAMTRDEFAELLDWTTWIEDPSDPGVATFWEWFQGLHLQLELRQSGADLVLVIGPTGGPVASVPPVPVVAAGEVVLQMAYDIGPVVASVSEAARAWERWRQTPAGRIAEADDTDHFLGDLAVLAESVAAVPPRFAASVAIGPSGIVGEMRGEGGRPAVDLGESGVLALLPQRSLAVHLDGATSLAEAAFGMMLRVEDQLASQELRALVRGQDAMADTLAMLTEGWYQRVGPLRELLRGPAREAWGPPSGFVIGPPNQVVLRDAEGGPLITARPPGMAWFARRNGGNGGLPLAREMLVALGTAMRGDSDELQRALRRDLGLGVPTVSLPLELLLPDGAPGVRADQGFDLHAFEHGDFVVFSTSLPLSRSILAAAAAGGAGVGPVAGEGRLLAWTATSGARLGHAVASLGTLVAMAHDRLLTKASDDGLGLVPVALAAHAVSGALGLLGPVEVITRQADPGVATSLRIGWARAADPAALPALLERARQALGTPAGDWRALRAEGRCHYADAEGTFAFLFTRDGRHRNRLHLPVPEQNGWDGQSAWASHERGMTRSAGPSDRDWLRMYALALTGQWTDPPADVRLAAANDALPGAAELLLRFPSGVVGRVVLDPATGLPEHFRCVGGPVDARDRFALSGWRDVGGRQLPHRVTRFSEDQQTDDFTVEEWQIVATVDDAEFVRPPDPVDHAFGDEPPEVETRIERGIPLIRIHGAQGAVWVHASPGSTATALRPWALRRLGMQPESALERVIVPELRIGPLRLRDVPVHIEQGDEPADPDTAIAGGLGWSFFRRCCVEFDAAAPSFRVLPPGAFAERQATWLPLTFHFRAPLVPVRFGDEEIPFLMLFAWGPPLVLMNDGTLPGDLLAGRPVAVLGSTTRYNAMLGARLSPRIGDVELRETPVGVPYGRHRHTGSDLFAGRFGNALLREHAILLVDYPGERAAFVPRPAGRTGR